MQNLKRWAFAQNGSVKSLQTLIDTFNGASLPAKDAVGAHMCCPEPAVHTQPETSTRVAEVVVAPTALHMGLAKERLTKSIQLAAQNCWVKGSGAYTGEVR